jgi:pimeloyl-ACP methyl ester carboxylesterase
MKSHIAHLPHRSLRYFESGEGRTLLLVHAFPLSADQWLPQLHRVPADGGSSRPIFGAFAASAPHSKIPAWPT